MLVLAIAAWALCKYLNWPTVDWLEELGREKALTVAQIVPAIVVAIFVFAVGTAFVVAQVVPPARGTRATSTLQGADGILRRACSALILGSILAVLTLPMGRCDLGGYLVRRLPLSFSIALGHDEHPVRRDRPEALQETAAAQG